MKGALGKNFFANLRTGHLVLILIMVLIVIFRIFINNSIALIYYYTWVIFILILVFAALCWKTVIKQFKKIKKINWIILAIIIVVALILRIYIMSEPSHLSQSEWDYKYIAKQLIYPDRDYRIVVTAEKPIGSSFMLHIFFLVFGVADHSVTIANITYSIMMVLVVFLLSYVVFKDEIQALLSAGLFAFFNTAIKYSSVAEAENMAALILLLAVFILYLALKEDNYKFYSLAALLFGFMVLTKVELGLMLVVAMVLLVVIKKKLLLDRKFMLPAFLLLVAIIPSLPYILVIRGVKYFLNIFFPQQIQFMGTTHDFPETYSLLGNFSSFQNSFLNLPMIGIILLFIALISIKKDYKSYFVHAFLFVFILFYAFFMWQYHYRYLMMIYPLIAVLMAKGLFNIVGFLKKLFSKKQLYKIGVVLSIVFLIFMFLHQISHELADPVRKRYADEFRADIQEVRSILEEQNAILICPQYAYLHFWCDYEYSDNYVHSTERAFQIIETEPDRPIFVMLQIKEGSSLSIRTISCLDYYKPFDRNCVKVKEFSTGNVDFYKLVRLNET